MIDNLLSTSLSYDTLVVFSPRVEMNKGYVISIGHCTECSGKRWFKKDSKKGL